MSNANANSTARNNSGVNRVFPSPNPDASSIIPYDGIVRGEHKEDVYSSWADKNKLEEEKKYEYWRTSKLANQTDIWGSCKKMDRGGVLYKKCDHPECKSIIDTDEVTQNKMKKYYDNVHK